MGAKLAFHGENKAAVVAGKHPCLSFYLDERFLIHCSGLVYRLITGLYISKNWIFVSFRFFMSCLIFIFVKPTTRLWLQKMPFTG